MPDEKDENMMESQRHDLYGPIHKTLRLALSETLVLLGTTDFALDADARAAVDAVRQLLRFCESHLVHEETFVHPRLGARRYDVAKLDADHAEHRHMFASLGARLAGVETAPAPRRRQLGHRLYLEFSAFCANTLLHLYEEEVDVQPVLWSALSDEELQATEQAIVGSIPPEEMAVQLPLMVRSVAPHERAAMLLELRAGAPEEFFNAVVGAVKTLLPATDWQRLSFDLELTA
jgi:hypothetical protein